MNAELKRDIVTYAIEVMELHEDHHNDGTDAVSDHELACGLDLVGKYKEDTIKQFHNNSNELSAVLKSCFTKEQLEGCAVVWAKHIVAWAVVIYDTATRPTYHNCDSLGNCRSEKKQ